jgi:antitoxin VapB
MVILVMEGRTRLPIRPRLARDGALSALYRKSLLQADEGGVSGGPDVKLLRKCRCDIRFFQGDIVMPLLIGDEELAGMTVALSPLHEGARVKVLFEERLARARAMADALGPSNPEFDQKAFIDELWDDL